MSDENLERITILLQARDRDFARAMDRNNKLIARLTRDATQNTARMQSQVESHFNKMASSAGSFAASFAKGLVAGAVGTAMAMFTTRLREQVSALSSLGKAARDAGLDVEDMQGMMRGFERSARVSAEEITRAFVDFNGRVGQAVNGTGELARVVERYGLSLRRPTGEMKTQAELMREIAELIRRARSESERAAIAQAAFGEVGRRMAQTLAGGADGINDMIAQAQEAGHVFDRNLIQRAEILDDKFDNLTRSVGRFFRALAVGMVSGGVETPADTLERLFGTLDRARSTLGESVFEALIGEAGELSTEVDATAGAIARAFDGAYGHVMRFASGMADITGQLSDLGRIDEMLRFDDLVAGIEQLVVDLNAGRIGADQFETELASALRQAAQVLIELDRIGGVDVSGAVSSISALQAALSAALTEARRLNAALPGGAPPSGSPMSLIGRVRDEMTERARGVRTLMEEEGRLASRTRERISLESELDAVIRRAREQHITLTRDEAEAIARRNLQLRAAANPSDGGGGGRATESVYDRTVASLRERIDGLEIEAAALVAAAASGREYGAAIDFARRRAELMHAALQDGREITPALQAEIDALAEAYVSAGLAAEEAAARMDQVRAQSERGVEAITDLFMSLTQGGNAAKAALARLLAEMARVQMQRALLGLEGGGGLFRWLGGLLGGGIPAYASGTSYHPGGLARINERGGEIVDLPRGARVIPADVSRQMARSSGPQQIVLRLEMSEDINARIVSGAEGVAVQVVQQYDRALPGRVRQISGDPRRK